MTQRIRKTQEFSHQSTNFMPDRLSWILADRNMKLETGGGWWQQDEGWEMWGNQGVSSQVLFLKNYSNSNWLKRRLLLSLTWSQLPTLIQNIWAIPSSVVADREQSALTEFSQLRLEGKLLPGCIEEHTEQKEAGPEGSCIIRHQREGHNQDLA